MCIPAGEESVVNEEKKKMTIGAMKAEKNASKRGNFNFGGAGAIGDLAGKATTSLEKKKRFPPREKSTVG